MTDKLEPVSPLALPANRKPARARHQPEKAGSMTQKQRDLSSMATEYLTRAPMDMKAELTREQGDTFSIPDVASIARHTIEQHLDEQTAEIKDTLALDGEQDTRPPLLRRRTQDEMLRALRILASDRPRARDDESPQVLEDAIYEVATLRQVVADLMQSASSMYQGGMASIRKMTER